MPRTGRRAARLLLLFPSGSFLYTECANRVALNSISLWYQVAIPRPYWYDLLLLSKQKSIRPSKPPNFLDWELMWGIFRATSKGAICALLRCAEPCPAVPRCTVAMRLRTSKRELHRPRSASGRCETPCTQHGMCVQLLR